MGMGYGQSSPTFGLGGLTAQNVFSPNYLSIASNGHIGIGTTAPGFPLSMPNTLGDKIALYGSSGAHFGFGVQNNKFQIHTDTNAADVVFGYGASGNMTETMTIKGNGIVLIGTTTALGKLNVGTKTASWDARGKLVDGGGFGTDEREAGQPLSICADGFMLAAQFSVSSDVRIKTAIHPTNGAEDLKSLLGIQITDYRHIDTVVNGNSSKKKVIAQQVESVYPIAVSKDRGVVPDIYRNAPFRDGWVEMVSSLKVGERVKLIGPSGESVTEVLEVKDGGFRTAFQPGGDKVFVYGREVLDFHTVDYDAIAMLNVSATQQIKREKDAEIKALQDENSALRAKLAVQSDTTDSLEARLIALERRMSGEGEAKTVSLKTAKAAE